MPRGFGRARVLSANATPTLTSIDVGFGPVGGGTVVHLTGTNFTAGGGLTGATVNGQALTAFVVDNATTCHGTTPAATGGTEVANTTVAVTGPGGSASLVNAWSYWPAGYKCAIVSWLGITGSAPITKIADQSPNGNDFNQNARIGATLVTNVQNGKPAIRFTAASTQSMQLGDGTGANYPASRLIGVGTGFSYVLAITWRTAISTNLAGTYDNEAVWSDGSVADGGYIGYHARSTGPVAMAYIFPGADIHADQGITVGTPYLASVVYDNVHEKHWVNGASLVQTAASGAPTHTGNNPKLGVNYADAHWFEGDFFAGVWFDYVLTDPQRNVVEQSLRLLLNLF